MAAEVITIDLSSDDDSPPPSRRAPPTSNKSPAPRASFGGPSSQQRRPSSFNGLPQAATSSLSSKKGGGSLISARKSSGSSAPSGRGAGAKASRKSIQLVITDSDEEETDEDEQQVADALRPADKAKKQIASDSGDDDPIAIRPSASPSKARPPSTASAVEGSTPHARKPSSSNQNTFQNLPSPHDNPPAALQRRPSSTRPSDVAEATPSLAAARHLSSQPSSRKHTSKPNDRALPTSSNGSASGSRRRFSAPMSLQFGRRVPKKRLSLQDGGENHALFKDRFSSLSQDEMEEDSRPSGKGASRRTTFDAAGNEIMDQQALAAKDDGSVATKAEEARASTSSQPQGGKRPSTDTVLTPPSPPKRRFSASLPSLAATVKIKNDWSRDGELDRRPSPFLDAQPKALKSPVLGAAPSLAKAEDDQIDELVENAGEGEVAQQQREYHSTSDDELIEVEDVGKAIQQQRQQQPLHRISDDEMEVDEDDERQISPELGLSTYTAAEKGKGRAMDLDQDDSTLMPPPPPPRLASARSDVDPQAPSPSTSAKTARKSTGAPIKAGYARKSTGGGPTLARKSVASKPKPVAHASLSGAGKRQKGITWAELIDLTGSTDEEEGGSGNAEDDKGEEEEDQLSPMETDESPRALPDVVEEEEPVEEEMAEEQQLTFEEQAGDHAHAEQPTALADDLADMPVADDSTTANFVKETITYTQRVTLETSDNDITATQEIVEISSSRRTRSGARPAPAPPVVKSKPAKKEASKTAIVEPTLVEMPAEVPTETPAEMEGRAQAFMDRERATRSSWRQIAGPSFSGELQEVEENIRHVQLRDQRFNWANGDAAPLVADSDDTALLESIIHQANLAHLPRAPGDHPRIRIVPTSDGLPPFTPPWEFVYTHRVIYPPNVPPTQARGCGCEGDCGSAENEATCACRPRQQRASTVKTLLHDPFPRSGMTGFAYTEDGLVKPELLESYAMEPIIECNSECGCDESCLNRVVGKIPSVSVDIINTGRKGWAIRNPPSYTYRLWPDGEELTFEGNVIKKGTPLGIYASEVLVPDDGEDRARTLYDKVERNYLFDIDHEALMEERRLQQPDLVDAARAAQEAAETAAPPARGARKKKKKLSEKERLASSQAGLKVLRGMGRVAFEAMDRKEEGERMPDTEDMEPAYVLDAFFYGNWTRFANHSCSKFNTAVCPVFVDEADWSRPLYVFIASSDIQPGEEIAITYHGHRPELDGEDLASYQAEANTTRNKAKKSSRCYCGEDLCRGVMFRDYAKEQAAQLAWEKAKKAARRQGRQKQVAQKSTGGKAPRRQLL